jgi:hypothetical protein
MDSFCKEKLKSSCNKACPSSKSLANNNTVLVKQCLIETFLEEIHFDIFCLEYPRKWFAVFICRQSSGGNLQASYHLKENVAVEYLLVLILHGRSWFQILTQKLAVSAKVVCGFSWSLQKNAGIIP